MKIGFTWIAFATLTLCVHIVLASEHDEINRIRQNRVQTLMQYAEYKKLFSMPSPSPTLEVVTEPLQRRTNLLLECGSSNITIGNTHLFEACHMFEDCNLNGKRDQCDIQCGSSLDLDKNGIPDECQARYDFILQEEMAVEQQYFYSHTYTPRGTPTCGDNVCDPSSENCTTCESDCGCCPSLETFEYSINATTGYTFHILANVTGYNISSLSIPYNGFYVNGTCEPSNSTYLVVVPVNGSIAVGSFNRVPKGQLCSVYSVCNDTCCPRGVIIWDVTDIPRCNSLEIDPLIYVYQTNETFNISNYFAYVTSPVTDYIIYREPYYGNSTELGAIFSYDSFGNFSGNDTVEIEACNNYSLCAVCLINIDVIRSPICANDYATGLFPNSFIINVLANDLYVDTQFNFTVNDLTVTKFSNTTGNFAIMSNGSLIYTPGQNYTLTDIAEYTICNDNLTCSTCDIYITLSSGVQCVNDVFSIFRGVQNTLDILQNDIDYQYTNKSSLTVIIVNQFSSGTATLDTQNDLVFTSNLIDGYDSLNYTVIDPSGYNSTCSVTVHVTSMPVCGPNNFTVAYNSINNTFNLTALDSNPSGPAENTTLGIYLYSNVTTENGTVITDGLFETFVLYTTPVNYTGYDSFVYELCDSRLVCVNCTTYVDVNASAPVSSSSSSSSSSAATSSSASSSSSSFSSSSSSVSSSSSSSVSSSSTPTSDTSSSQSSSSSQTSATSSSASLTTGDTSSGSSDTSSSAVVTLFNTFPGAHTPVTESSTAAMIIPLVAGVLGSALFVAIVCVVFFKFGDTGVPLVKKKKTKKRSKDLEGGNGKDDGVRNRLLGPRARSPVKKNFG